MRGSHILQLGLKELWTLARDPMMLALIFFAFTFAIYSATVAIPETLQAAPIAIVDEDQSPLSYRITNAFRPPYFLEPISVTLSEMDDRMDDGLDTFALNIPADFQRDVLAGRSPTLQLNVDATRISQGFTGSPYVVSIVNEEIDRFVSRYRGTPESAVTLAERVRFNPQLSKAWFGAVMKLIDQVTMLGIILTGAALIRERERGTIEHLLVMPVTPFEIMTSKIWSMGLVVLIACAFSLTFVVQGLLNVPVAGSTSLFLCGTALHLFAITSMGILMGTYAHSMPQFGLLIMLILLPLQMLSGGTTPRESMPQFIQDLMLLAPNTHFVKLAQSILYRGAGLEIVWPQFLALVLIGGVLFTLSLVRFRQTIGTMA